MAEIPEKATKVFRRCLEEPVAEELISRLHPIVDVVVTVEDIRRYYALHRSKLEEAIECTLRNLGLALDDPAGEFLEVLFKRTFPPHRR